MTFDWNLISQDDRQIAIQYLADRIKNCVLPPPDYSFFPPNREYQFRWYLTPTWRNDKLPATFLHIMTGDDPTNELHDHDWHNTTNVLAGELIEYYDPFPWKRGASPLEGVRRLKVGDSIWRNAKEAHRLELPKGVLYAMTLFTIGPKIRTNLRWKIK